MVTTNMPITNSHLQQSQFYFPSLTKCFINLPDVTNYIYNKSIAKSLILDLTFCHKHVLRKSENEGPRHCKEAIFCDK